MRPREGTALLVALLVLVLAGAVAATAGRWAILGQQVARGWHDTTRRSAGLESAAASWLAGDSLIPTASWGVVDSLEALQFDPLGGASQLELVCRRLAAAPAGSAVSTCLPARGFLRTVR